MKKSSVSVGLLAAGFFASSSLAAMPAQAQTLPNFIINAVAQVTAYSAEPLDDNTSIKQGSGVFVDNSGCLYTNSHVVIDTETGQLEPHIGVAIQTDRSRKPQLAYEGEVLFVDQNVDLAYVCPLETTRVFTDYFDRFTTPQFDSRAFGEDVWVLGYPGAGEGTITASPGHIIGFINEPDISEWSGLVKLDVSLLKLYKTDALAGPGISGGVMINDKYQLVGVPFAGTQIPGAFSFVLSEDVYQTFEERLAQHMKDTGAWPADCAYDDSVGYYEREGVLYNDPKCSSVRNLAMEHEVKTTYKAFCSVDISHDRLLNAVKRSQELGDLSAWSDSIVARCGLPANRPSSK